MPVSRHSFRRVIGDIVHRHHNKTDPTNGYHRKTSRSDKKLDRNSLISNDSLSVCFNQINNSSFIYLYIFSHHKLITNDYINVKKKFINLLVISIKF